MGKRSIKILYPKLYRGELAFFDTFTLFDDYENFLIEKLLIERYPRKEFEEIFLRRLPHERC